MPMNKLSIVALLVAIVALGAYFVHPSAAVKLGGVTNYDEVDATAIKIGGANGSRVGPIIATTCNLSQSSAGSHAATTSKEYFCAVTGVVANDYINVILPVGAGNNPNGAGSIFGGFVVNGAYATTTGVIGVNIANMTGAATSTFPQATTSVTVLVQHPLSSVPGL